MDVSRRSAIAVLIIILLTVSCKTKHTITTKETRKETSELVTKQKPYTLSSEQRIKFDSEGKIKPITMKIRHNEADGIVEIKDNIVKFSVVQKDTLVTERIVTQKEGIDVISDTEEVKPQKGTVLHWWKTFKTKVVVWSLILNVIFIAGKIMQLTRRVYLPY